MDTLLRDLRYALRMLARSRGLTLTAILTLALGIGVNSAIFSAVNAVLLRPLPLRDAGRLVTVVMSNPKFNATGAPPGFAVYARWKQNARLFESIAAAETGTATLEAGAQPVKLWRVSASFLPTLGVNPALGRNFTADEDQPGGPRTAILARGDASVLGSTIRLDGVSYTVIGVLPPGFHVDGRPADIYVPSAKSPNAREWVPVNVYARLKPHVTPEQATAGLEALGSPARDPFPWHANVWKLRDFEVREVRLSLWVLLGAVGLVLLIACANIASLRLAKASARRQEIAMRAALGAGRGRLLRQLLTESTLLAVAGGAAGIGVAALSIRALPFLIHERLPGLLEQTRIDGAVLAFTLALSVLTGIVFGIVPAVMVSRQDPYETLKARTGCPAASARQFQLLIVGETALALVLAIGATLLIRTFFYLRDVAPGFRVDGLLVATVNSERTRFASREQCLNYYEDLARSVRATPGVRSATFASAMPLSGDNVAMTWPVEGQPPPQPGEAVVQWQRTVDTSYFETMQIPLRRGRLFDARDTLNSPKVVIVNEAFVRRYWPNQDPIGKHIGGGPVPLFEIIGVVADVRHQDTTKEAPNEVFFNYQQGPTARVSIAVRADPAVYPRPRDLEPGVRHAIATVAGAQSVTRIAEMRQVISDRIAPKRLSAQLIAVFAALAGVLALIGIYGVLSFSVAQRTHEIGVRMALGAEPVALLAMVVRQAAGLASAGTATGIVAALALTRVLKTLVYGITATDPSTYTLVAAATLALSVLAAALPAWRAARVDPLEALRQD